MAIFSLTFLEQDAMSLCEQTHVSYLSTLDRLLNQDCVLQKIYHLGTLMCIFKF